MTWRFQRTTLTVPCLITPQYKYISQIGLTCPLTCIFQMVSHRAYVIILFPIVIKVLYGKSLYTSILHKLLILFASVTGIGYYNRGCPMISFLKIFQKRNQLRIVAELCLGGCCDGKCQCDGYRRCDDTVHFHLI